MNLKELKKAGICFDFCPDAVVPEIPKVQDVLFAMRLVDTDVSYMFALANHTTYIVNVALVVAAVTYEIFYEKYDEAKARQVIAKAIVELCPPSARCLFKSVYTDAKRIAGEAVPLPNKPSRDELLELCECNSCVNLRFKEAQEI